VFSHLPFSAPWLSFWASSWLNVLKVLLYFLALVCLLFAFGVFFLPLPPEPKPDAMTEQGERDAIDSLGLRPDMGEPTNDPITIHRKTLEILRQRTESPDSTWRVAWLFSKTTMFFGITSGICLLLLGRRVGK
jgi:hypothetical protein